MQDHELRNGAIEYPVLTGVFMYASALFVDKGDDFLRISALLLTPFALLVAYLVARLAGWRALLWSLAPALILYAFHNWDLLVVAAAVTGIWLWARGHPAWAGVAFGIGAAFKMWPIFFLAPLLLDGWRSGSFRRGLGAAAAGVGTFVAINLPFALVNFDGWWATYAFHQERGPNFDSIWWVGWAEWGAEKVSLVSSALTAGFFLVILGVSWWLGRRRGDYPFVQTCAALLVAFLLWNKVHSPQYTLWILPFFALLHLNVLWWFAYAIADLAVYIGVFRWFHDFGQGMGDDSAALELMKVGIWARAGLLLALVALFLGTRRAPPPEEPEASATEAPEPDREPRLNLDVAPPG